MVVAEPRRARRLDGILEVGNFLDVPTLKTGWIALAEVEAGGRDKAFSSSQLTSWRRPFSNGVWILLAAIMFSSGIFYGIFEGEATAASAAQGARQRFFLSLSFSSIVRVGVYQSVTLYTGAGSFEPTKIRGKLFVIFFSFFTLLLVSAYVSGVLES